jgi:hypothetical protein
LAMADSDRDEQGRFVKGNQSAKTSALKHGGEAAVKAIQHGEPLTGLAAEAERAVVDELESRGPAALEVRNACRAQAACDLYWNAIQAVADQGNLEMLDRYVARFGWLVGVSLRAWAQVKKAGGSGEDPHIVDAMKAAKEAKDDGQH